MSNINLIIKWNKQDYNVNISLSQTYVDLKNKIFELTKVLPERQKIMGIKSSNDTSLLSTLNLKNNQKIMMTGTPEQNILVQQDEDPNVLNDLDDISDVSMINPQNAQVFLDKVQARIKTYEINQKNPPRQGKKLLVLDVDYTLFDHRSPASNAAVLKRPYLNEMLASVYPYYDIIIWSATSMKWIELKMQELRVFPSESYSCVAYFDAGAMITVYTEDRGVFETKPLPVIWGKYPEFYNKTNSIIVDDLRRNFVMNPENGLRIEAFRNAPLEGHKDDELYYLTQYLLLIKDNSDISTLNHKKWKKYVQKNQDKLKEIISQKIQSHMLENAQNKEDNNNNSNDNNTNQNNNTNKEDNNNNNSKDNNTNQNNSTQNNNTNNE